eukprot:scaffold9.g3099.t1
MDGDQAADLAVFVACACLLLAYNAAYFALPLGAACCGRQWSSIWAVSQRRGEWMAMLMEADPKEAILAVQTLRNQVTGVGLLSAAMGVIAAQMVALLVDASKLEQVDKYVARDPLGPRSFAAPEVKCTRLAIHLGFVVRIVAADPLRHARLAARAKALTARASAYFAVGLRLFFSSLPFVLWLLGPTALLVTTVLEVSALFAMDVLPLPLEAEEGSAAAADGAAVTQCVAAKGAAKPHSSSNTPCTPDACRSIARKSSLRLSSSDGLTANKCVRFDLSRNQSWEIASLPEGTAEPTASTAVPAATTAVPAAATAAPSSRRCARRASNRWTPARRSLADDAEDVRPRCAASPSSAVAAKKDRRTATPTARTCCSPCDSGTCWCEAAALAQRCEARLAAPRGAPPHGAPEGRAVLAARDAARSRGSWNRSRS